MSNLYSRGVGTLVGPYRARAQRFAAGAMDFHRGGTHFYRRGMMVGGVKDSIVGFIIDVAHLLLLVGGLYLLFTSIF